LLKGLVLVKDQTIEKSAITLLQGYLEKIPSLQIDRIESNQASFQFWVRVQDQSHLLVPQIKNNGQPRWARLAAYELKDSLTGKKDAYGIFVAPYISPQAGKICEKAGIGYLDMAGNCLLSFGTVYIRQASVPNPKVQKRELRSLYSPKAERSLRALLIEPQRTWKITELAQTVGVSLGQVANVKKLLLDREWISTPADGIRLTNPAALLSEWAQAYNFRRNEVVGCYAMAEIQEIEGQLVETCQKLGMRYALADFSSAARIAPMVLYQRASAYVQGDIGVLIKTLDWKHVTSGENVNLLVPYDEGVFYGSKEVDEISITAPIQTYLDLQYYRGRGQEAAQAVRKEIEKTW
jgi:hypothetical protein